MKQKELTDKQNRFCQEYIVDCNATQAAIRAGYSEKTAEQTAARVLRNVKVKERISELEKPALKKAQVTCERVVDELAKIAFSDITKFITMQQGKGISLEAIEKLPPHLTACISDLSEYETVQGLKRFRFKLHDKTKALDLLGRYLSMFTDKINVNATMESRYAHMTDDELLQRFKELGGNSNIELAR